MRKEEVIDYEKDPVFLHMLLDELPAIIFATVYLKPGDLRSLVTVWSNLYTQKFVGLTRDEIKEMGFCFFENTFHPADLEIFNEIAEVGTSGQLNHVFTSIHRIKPISGNEFVWLYGHSVILNRYENGFPKLFLTISFEINSYMNTKNQLTEALKVIGRLQHEMQFKTLTKREKEVLGSISRGLTNKQISTQLFISESTVKTHRNNILKKLHIKNSAALSAFAAKCGIN